MNECISGSGLGEVTRCSCCLGSSLMYLRLYCFCFTLSLYLGTHTGVWFSCVLVYISLPSFKCFDLLYFLSFHLLSFINCIPYHMIGIFHWIFFLNFMISVVPLAYTHTLAAGLACLAWPLPACRPTARPAWLAAVRSPLPPQTQREEAAGGVGGNGGGEGPQGGTGAARRGGVGAQRRVGLWMHRLTPTPHPSHHPTTTTHNTSSSHPCMRSSEHVAGWGCGEC